MPRLERVTRVIDGDTFETASKKRVRLAGADTPELGKSGGAAAKRNLEKMIGGKTVYINTVAHGKYGRDIAKVNVGSKSVNNAVKNRTKRPKK